MNSNFDTDHPL